MMAHLRQAIARLLSLLIITSSPALALNANRISQNPSFAKRQTSTPSVEPLQCFQVAQPVLGPSGPVVYPPVTQNAKDSRGSSPEDCTLVLMEHSFGWSYGMPFIGDYIPPKCEFNRVIVNFTVTSAGRQFDRLALMYFGDTEVWRTSTAQPRRTGIIWTYWKDMTEYMYFWKTPQKIIFDLGNLLDDKYTGSFNTTLTATFFKSDVAPSNGPPADLIIPISARKSGENAISAWNVPEQDAVNTISFPRNARRAVFSVSANGQQAEEFWWANVPQSDVAVFNETAGTFYGWSPWREVQVLIDDKPAGFYWPFPIIFTGGISPSFHRPIVGVDAFDLREHEIDITPWLGFLCDGKSHTFKILVAGLADNDTDVTVVSPVAMYWVVTGKIFVWLDDEGSVTRHREYHASSSITPQLSHEITTNPGATQNETLKYRVEVSRENSVKARLVTQQGERWVEWTQSLYYKNDGLIEAFGFDQTNDIVTDGTEQAAGETPYRTKYAYPLRAWSAYRVSKETGDFSINATLAQGLNLEVEGASVFPTGLDAYQHLVNEFGGIKSSRLSTSRTGSAYFFQTGDGKNGSAFGNTEQDLTFSAVRDDASAPATLFTRHVKAVNDSLVEDRGKMAGGLGDFSPLPFSINRLTAVDNRDFAPAKLLGTGLGALRGDDFPSTDSLESAGGQMFSQ